MKNLETFDDYLEDMMDDYIALNFHGQHYDSAIRFVEVLLQRLKEQSEKSVDKKIKDISDKWLSKGAL